MAYFTASMQQAEQRRLDRQMIGYCRVTFLRVGQHFKRAGDLGHLRQSKQVEHKLHLGHVVRTNYADSVSRIRSPAAGLCDTSPHTDKHITTEHILLAVQDSSTNISLIDDSSPVAETITSIYSAHVFNDQPT